MTYTPCVSTPVMETLADFSSALTIAGFFITSNLDLGIYGAC